MRLHLVSIHKSAAKVAIDFVKVQAVVACKEALGECHISTHLVDIAGTTGIVTSCLNAATKSFIALEANHIIGGGSLNAYLNQFTANSTGVEVLAGPQEGTALGNALVQVRAAGLVDSLKEMRAIIGRSIELRTY